MRVTRRERASCHSCREISCHTSQLICRFIYQRCLPLLNSFGTQTLVTLAMYTIRSPHVVVLYAGREVTIRQCNTRLQEFRDQVDTYNTYAINTVGNLTAWTFNCSEGDQWECDPLQWANFFETKESNGWGGRRGKGDWQCGIAAELAPYKSTSAPCSPRCKPPKTQPSGRGRYRRRPYISNTDRNNYRDNVCPTKKQEMRDWLKTKWDEKLLTPLQNYTLYARCAG